MFEESKYERRNKGGEKEGGRNGIYLGVTDAFATATNVALRLSLQVELLGLIIVGREKN